MATQPSNDRPSSPQDKVAVNQMEHVLTTDDPALMKQPVIEKVDEFGAHTKTDPKEIALVKKIDWYILVPSNMILNRVRPSWYMAGNAIPSLRMKKASTYFSKAS
ncbi:hypothetical protein ColLi_00271 [Colletotrichum liriopes]|uniref:Uncharacterized protein n=1 Tax=Colletotrichum liriopes TaxID=708192 RepID=A0AA37GAU2_9PEZI|nr:hypothetical protein ColLi_00271 [Colletotrichum liriopes]